MNVKDWLDSKIRILQTTIKHKEEQMIKNGQANLDWLNNKIEQMQLELEDCKLKNPAVRQEFQDEQHLLIDKYIRERDECQLRLLQNETDVAELHNLLTLYKLELSNIAIG